MLTNLDLDQNALNEMKTDLAACFRAAADFGLSEGICNHFSSVVPGREDLFIVNPFGLAFSEIRASDLLVCDFDNNVLQGDGVPEDTAFFIHSRIHKRVPRARVAFHTHMPYATALSMVEGAPLKWTCQNALRFYGRTLVDENYNGLALDGSEGDRIADCIGEAEIVFMRNHGVMVIGETVADAWDDLYYLERTCEVQTIAESTGRALLEVPSAVAEETYRQFRLGSKLGAEHHLKSIKRRLDSTGSDYGA
ncbi:aldolase (plasmid) [Rhizobium sp. RCAM05350]|uniref:aldolase n=1 Tax=Rhizobium sp. RCAM05350 TaxID=2895568 RepID=UPI002076792C|nr:aldolase [Rhizobium sp. RCAM05350]URK89438.1 aldolase [Rhizobium sp. RCAM05350]